MTSTPMSLSMLDDRLDAFGYGLKLRAYRLLMTLDVMDPDNLILLRQGLSAASARQPAETVWVFSALEQLAAWMAVDGQDRDLDDEVQELAANVTAARQFDEALLVLMTRGSAERSQ